MTLTADSPYDIKLSTGRESKSYGLIFDEGMGSFEVSSLARDDSVFVRAVGKRVGDFDEQRSWKGGRGYDKLSDNPEGFWDSKDAWTLSKGHAASGLLWRFAKGIRKATTNFSSSKSWRSLYGATRGISVSFTPDETGNYDKVMLWLRWVGSLAASNVVTVRLHSDTAGSPGTVLQTVTKNVSDIGDWVSQLLVFDWSGTQALTAGTTYHITVYGATDSIEGSHWEILVNASGSSSKVSAETSDPPGSWSSPSPTFSMLYRIVDVDVVRTFWQFFLDNHLYLVDVKDDGTTASQIYVSGDRGQATGGSTMTLVDTNFGCRSTAWPDNVLVGAMIRFKKNGRWYYATIASHTGSTYTFASATTVAPASGNPYFIYATEWFTEITGHGLGVVTGEPATLGQIVYFPQGDAVAIRDMAIDYTQSNNHKFRSEAGATPAANPSKYATFLMASHDRTDGAIMWRANNNTVTVSTSKYKAYATDLAFNPSIQAGDTTYPITGLDEKDGALIVFKENGHGAVQAGAYTALITGEEDTPDPSNGLASVAVDKFLYYSWGHTIIRVYGSSNDDIGQDYRGFGLPAGREGNYAYLDAYLSSLVLGAVDAGSTGISCVMAFDGIGFHEFLRGYTTGARIRMVKVQPNPTTRARVWSDVGGDLVYQEMPLKKASPLLDTGALYNHESVIESSIIDMGTASDLPKLIKELTATVKNLSAQGQEIYLDYQVDKDCHTTSWVQATALLESPESTAALGLQNITRFCYRLRMCTADATKPIDVEGVIPSGYARTPLKQVWTMRIRSGGIYQVGGLETQNQGQLWKWLMDNARAPYFVTMESKYIEADGYSVIIHPSRSFPYKPPRPGELGEAYMTLVLEEL